tara:strand:- start:83 stop:187 length:105 start_codon:yes stop_codon:yes gene_type:complete
MKYIESLDTPDFLDLVEIEMITKDIEHYHMQGDK